MARPKRAFRIRAVTLGAAAVVLISPLVGSAAAQIRWTVDPQTSLAWWQVDPHHNHLWATTCPRDPSWQPGEGRDMGYYVNYAFRPKTYDAGRTESRVPLYPRRTVRPLCSPAVRGAVIAPDTVSWNGIRGTVAVTAEMLETGLGTRDAFARKAVLETREYPDIRFTLDSLVAVERGDTLRGTAVGTFELHGVRKRVEAAVRAWRESAGLRVLARFQVPARTLVDEYGLSRWALELGVVAGSWKVLHVGVDLILKPTLE